MTCSDIINLIIAVLTAFAAISAMCTAIKANEIAEQSFEISKSVYEHSQSDRISVWLVKGERGDDIILRNGSEAPIYDVFVGAGIANKGDECKLTKGLSSSSSNSHGLNHSLGVVPPGTWIIKAGLVMGGMSSIPGATVVFKDMYGKTWVRDAAGDLHDKGIVTPADVLDLYKLGEVPYGQEEYKEYKQ